MAGDQGDCSLRELEPNDWSSPRRSVTDLLERFRLWLRFTGPARIASGVGAAVVVAGVAFWLLRTPALPTEAGLPMARASTTVSSPTVGGSAIAPPAGPAASSTSTDVTIIVHVAGAVNAPGVYRLSAASRVGDAIVAAGGSSADADPDALNLAAAVLDGDRIDVPTVGEMTPPALTTLPPGQLHAPPASAADGANLAPVDLNTATAAELEVLPGVGPATSSAIVTYRTEHGPFRSVDDLDEVPGIGPAKLGALRDLVTV